MNTGKSPKAKKSKSAVIFEEYRRGGEGFAKWVEDHVCIPIVPVGSTMSEWCPVSDLPDTPHPITGRSYKGFWEKQKEVMNEALEMDENGFFKHNLIVLCWMRGDGKTFLACLAQLWRFFVFPLQNIVLCANSQNLADFVSYSTIRKIIENSPKLFNIVGARNIQAQEIRLTDSSGNVMSTIQNISSYSGIVSGITSFSFTEIHELKTSEFYEKVYGSIRNVPNAMGIIDTTVSNRDHILYRTYDGVVKGKNPLVYFSYRSSKMADYRDYWHPHNTQAQLDSFKTTFLPSAFDRYFRNLWNSGAEKVFSVEQIQAVSYFGVEKSIAMQSQLFALLKKRNKIIDGVDNFVTKVEKAGYDSDKLMYSDRADEISTMEDGLWSVDSVYQIRDKYGKPQKVSVDTLDMLSDMFDTDWGIFSGIDRAQPMKKKTAARTIVTIGAKGLPGSRSNSALANIEVPNYLYLLLHLTSIEDHSLELIKSELFDANEEYDGLDMVTSETWGIWDMMTWCEEHDINIQTVHPSYDKQMGAFTELYSLISKGRFKAPPTGVPGSREDDVMIEELSMFDHNEEKKWFGSPEKKMKYGVQDDSCYSLTWGLWGAKALTVDDFRPRSGKKFFGFMLNGVGLSGDY